MSAPPIQLSHDAACGDADADSPAQPPPARFASLASLLAPLDAETFAASHRESSPAVVARSSPDHYRALFTPDDLDFVVSLGCLLNNSSVELLGARVTRPGAAGDEIAESNRVGGTHADEVVRDQPEVASPRFPENVATVFAAYRAGASVRVIGAHRYWKPLWTLCRELQQELSFPVRANAYLTPPGARGAELHYDTHDVFVLQIAGRKRWRVYRPVEPLALEHLPALATERREDVEFRRGARAKRRVGLDRAACGEPVVEAALEAGDLLYVPRAFVHEAESEAEASLHVSVGVHSLTWTDLLAVALGRRANVDERLRASLAPGFARGEGDARQIEDRARTLLADFAREASASEALAEIAANMSWDEQALCDGALFESSAEVEVVGTTLVERRPGLNATLAREGQTVVLHGGHTSFSAPAPLADALDFVARTPRFRVAEVAGSLSEAGKIALARRLIRDGFLRAARAG